MSVVSYEQAYADILATPLEEILVLTAAFLSVESKLTEGMATREDFPDGPLKDFFVEVASLADAYLP